MLTSLFLLLLSSSAVRTCSGIKGVKVTIVNHLNYTTQLMSVHCQSADDNLGTHLVDTNGEYAFEFDVDLSEKTLFWCHVEPDANYHADFDAFVGFGKEIAVRPSRIGVTSTYYRYWYATDYGVLRYKDGVVYTHVPWVRNAA